MTETHANETEHGPTPADRGPCFFFMLTFAIVLASRSVLRGGSFSHLRSTDEWAMFNTSLSPFLGASPKLLPWPGGAMRLAMLAIVPVAYAIDVHCHFSPDSFVRFLAEYSLHWERGVLQMRWVSALAASVGFASLVIPLRKLSGSWWIAIAGALCGSVVPAVLERSMMATSDSLALAFAMVALSFAMCRKNAALIGALLGIACATKVTMVFLAPPILVITLANAFVCGKRATLMTLVKFFAACAIAFWMVNPYIVTDPIREAKAIGGNLIFRYPLGSIPRGIEQGIGFWLLALGVIGLPFALIQKRWALFIGAGVALLMMAAVIKRSPQVDPHYFMPMVPPLILLGFGVLDSAIARRIEAFNDWRRVIAGGLLLALLIATSVRGYRADRDMIRETHEVVSPAQIWLAKMLESLPPQRVAAPRYAINFYTEVPVTPEYLRREINYRSASIAQGDREAEFLRGYGAPEDLARYLPANFNETERLLLADFQLRRRIADPNGFDLFTWVDSPENLPDAPLDRDTAINRFNSGELDLIIVNQPLPDRMPYSTLDGANAREPLWAYKK